MRSRVKEFGRKLPWRRQLVSRGQYSRASFTGIVGVVLLVAFPLGAQQPRCMVMFCFVQWFRCFISDPWFPSLLNLPGVGSRTPDQSRPPGLPKISYNSLIWFLSCLKNLEWFPYLNWTLILSIIKQFPNTRHSITDGEFLFSFEYFNLSIYKLSCRIEILKYFMILCIPDS